MTGQIIPFARPEKDCEHQSGEALCIGCRHTWVQVAPVGMWQFECPGCGADKGIFRHPLGGVVDDLAFSCNCGCEALTAYKRDGKFWLRCMSCGLDQTNAVFA